DSTYTGNDNDHILVEASLTISDDMTWPYLNDDISYLVDGLFEVEAHLDIEAGITLAFTPGSGIRVMSDGLFTAIGTEDDPIIFTADDTSQGWQGLVISRSEKDNQIKHATVEYGGGTDFRGYKANIQVGDTAKAKLDITNST